MNNVEEKVCKTQSPNPLVLTVVDLFLMCSPILILSGVLLIDGSSDMILKKPEWSFVSILFWAEALRDGGLVAKHQNIDEEQISSGYGFYSIFLILSALVLILDFQHSNGSNRVTTDVVYIWKYTWFVFSLCLFSYKRYMKYIFSCARKTV